ncbi:hypothetical protein AURDEDRAFT_164091 [Auricularia subglabra TFB-10046 SS5]|nr:hypothetical protein AURDEDRAFT_164091 [Auricularia subglabra TFB-10046 SS5]
MAAMLTPPYSDAGAEDWELLLPVSKLFNRSLGLPDVVLISADFVLFFVDSAMLLSASRNLFNHLPTGLAAGGDSHAHRALPSVRVQEDEAVLSVVLHAIYGFSLADCAPGLAELDAAADALINRYAAHIPPILSPGCIMYEAIIAQAHHYPLEAYMLAAFFGLEQLAVACSAHLVSFPLSTVTNQHALRMGPLFLCRLFNLHIDRIDSLRDLLVAPPSPHPPSPLCPQSRLDDLRRAWVIVAAAVLCDATPGIQTNELEAILRPLLARLCCRVCHQALSTHIGDLVRHWSSVKNTI